MKKVVFLMFLFCALFAGSTAYAETGWVTDGGFTYYYKADGTKAKGFQVIDGKRYYFYSTGGMAKGWLRLSGDRNYYLKSDGTMAAGFQAIDDKKYYFYSTGGMAKGWLRLSGDRNYYLKSDGTMATGFQAIDDKKYYFYSTGGMAKGWLNLPGGRKYYFTSDGSAATGFRTIDNKDYYFYSTGGMAKGWLKLPGDRRYYLNTDGTLALGWKTVNNKTYYLNGDGTIAKGAQTINNKRYQFNNDGTLTVGDAFLTATGGLYDLLFVNIKNDTALTDSQRLAAHRDSMALYENKYYIEQLNREFGKYIQGSFAWDYRNSYNQSNFLAFRKGTYWYDGAFVPTSEIYKRMQQQIGAKQLVITPTFNYTKEDIFIHPTRGGYVVSDVLSVKYTSGNGSLIAGMEPNLWYSIPYEVEFNFPGENQPSWTLWNYGDYGWLAAYGEYHVK